MKSLEEIRVANKAASKPKTSRAKYTVSAPPPRRKRKVRTNVSSIQVGGRVDLEDLAEALATELDASSLINFIIDLDIRVCDLNATIRLRDRLSGLIAAEEAHPDVPRGHVVHYATAMEFQCCAVPKGGDGSAWCSLAKGHRGQHAHADANGNWLTFSRVKRKP